MAKAMANLNKKKQEQRNKVVTMPRTDGGENAEAGGNGEEEAATEKPGRGKATAEDEKAKRKGAKKALRHAVKEAVKKNKEQIAGSLVTRTVGGRAGPGGHSGAGPVVEREDRGKGSRRRRRKEDRGGVRTACGF